MALTALVTRPEEDARPLAEALRTRGLAVVIEPLLAIRPLPEAAEGLAQDLAGVQALLFTSANGARAFAALSPRRDIGVLAVGDATATAARSLGFTAVESASGDVQDLARLAAERLKPAGGPLFHAAGSAVAGDLAQLLAASGFELRRRMLYESRPAEAFTAEALAALKQGAIDLVLLFSPRTAASFAQLAKAAGIDTKAMTALALSPNVALAVRELDWKTVETAARPDLPAMLELVDRRIAAEKEAKPAVSPIPASPPKPETPPVPPAAPAPPAVPAMPPRRNAGLGGILLAAIFGAALAGAALFGVMKYAPEQLNLLPAASGLAGGEALADLARRIEDLRGQISDVRGRLDSLPQNRPDLGDLPQRVTELEQKVAALPAASAPSPALPPEIAGLPDRVAALEAKLGQLKPLATPAAPTALPQQLAALDQRIAALEKLPQAQAGITAADLAALKSELAALKDSLAALDTRIQATAARTGVALALGDLRRAVESGRPYAGSLDGLKKAAAGDDQLAQALDPSIAALAPAAANGAPTLADLQASFADASAAILASTAAPEPAAGASLTDRVLAKLQSLVSIQPVSSNPSPGETTGDTVGAHVARAEEKLAGGDLDAAVGELSALAGKPADAAAPWLARAKTRLATEKALADLDSAVLAALANAGSGQ
jgi:uroporphyrinogen-III synthase